MSDADEMRDLLTYANYAKVGRALAVSKTTVSKWAAGEKVNPHRLQQVRDLLRPAVEEEPAPQWVERLLASAMALEGRNQVSDDELARAQAKAAAYLVAPRTPPRPRGGGGAAGQAA